MIMGFKLNNLNLQPLDCCITKTSLISFEIIGRNEIDILIANAIFPGIFNVLSPIINSNGGVLGKDFEVFIEDDEGDKTLSDDRARTLITEHNVAALMSGSSSRSLSIFNDAAFDAGVLFISPTATSPSITDLNDDDLFWRTAPSDAFQGRVAADYAKNTLNQSDVGIFYVNNEYGAGLAEEFSNNYVDLGGNVVVMLSFEEQADYSAVDFKPDLDLLFENQPFQQHI